VCIVILQAGDQRFHGPQVAQFAKRIGGGASYELIPVLQASDQRFHGPYIVQFTEGGGSGISDARITILQGGYFITNGVSRFAACKHNEQE